MRRTSIRETSNLIKSFQRRIRSEGFYLTPRHEKSVRRLIQRLHSAEPFCFIHADSKKLSNYYIELVVKRIEHLGENSILRFDPLRKDKLTEILNNELDELPLEKALQAGRPDKRRKIIVIQNEDELISEDWQDIELVCTSLPGANVGLLCNASGIDKSFIRSNRLMKDKRVLHAFFNAPTQNELKLLSVVARGRPEHRGVLQILQDLDLRYSSDTTPKEIELSRRETTEGGAALFNKLLKDAEQGISTSDSTHEAAESGQPKKKSYRGMLGLISIALALVAIYFLSGQTWT